MSTQRTTAQATSEAWAWVRAAQAGDREAFGLLYTRYAPEVARFIRRRVWDTALAEDLTSETFTRALRRLDTLRERRSDPGAWLTTIARNLIADHVKCSRTRFDRSVAEVPEQRNVLGQAGLEELAATREDRAIAAELIAQCLAGLTDDQREVVQLYDLAARRDLVEVARLMGRSERAVKGLRHRAMRGIREQLAERGLASMDDCSQIGWGCGRG
jgi:RNA polymerase sigma-70 factor (ECF subfamily)